jgi:hypothetical protein
MNPTHAQPSFISIVVALFMHCVSIVVARALHAM